MRANPYYMLLYYVVVVLFGTVFIAGLVLASVLQAFSLEAHALRRRRTRKHRNVPRSAATAPTPKQPDGPHALATEATGTRINSRCWFDECSF